jgi:hypothetical protein
MARKRTTPKSKTLSVFNEELAAAATTIIGEDAYAEGFAREETEGKIQVRAHAVIKGEQIYFAIAGVTADPPDEGIIQFELITSEEAEKALTPPEPEPPEPPEPVDYPQPAQ